MQTLTITLKQILNQTLSLTHSDSNFRNQNVPEGAIINIPT